MVKTISEIREKIDKKINVKGTVINSERIFDGKKFIFVMRYTHKKAAEKRKDNLRKEGYNVRIVKIKGIYLLYRSIFLQRYLKHKI